MLRTAALALAFFVAMSAAAAELRVPIPGRDDLVVDLPRGWQAQVKRANADLPPTITIVSASPRAFQLILTPIWPVGGAPAPTTSDIKSTVQDLATLAATHSVEREMKLIDLASSGKPGYYFSATERTSEPEGFKHLTQGAIAVNELRLTFKILVNGETGQVVSQALEMLRSVRRAHGKSAV